ncbi:hypothetical protein Cni_G15094 [Canna indica]|uniref:Transmembrane protein n=1 Tax=Canna indica TaxID=4628 RepID=A0AAQ3KHE0_9LILI|nr:hypothetical protein Cni_G15094 [Canna indica]
MATPESTEHDKNKCARTLEKLRQFKATDNPFIAEFSQVFDFVYRQHQLMLEKLLQWKKKLDRKLKKVKAWRKVSSVIFIAALAVVIVCSIIVAADRDGHGNRRRSSPWLGGEVDRFAGEEVPGRVGRGERELVTLMEFGTRVALGDLEDIEVMVDKLGDH